MKLHRIMIGAGYLLAFLALLGFSGESVFVFAMLSFAIGIYALSQNEVGPGLALLILAVICGGLGVFVAANRGSAPSQSAIAPGASNSYTITPPAHEPVTIINTHRNYHKIGEDFSVGYWSYRCNGVRWQRWASSPYGSSMETAKAMFLVVDLTIQNNDQSASILPPLKLVDSQGREHDESAVFAAGIFHILEKLNPGVSSRGQVYFDVPPGNYYLKVSGGIQSQESSFVVLTVAENLQDERGIANRPIRIGAAELLAAYDDDEDGANARYKDRGLIISGKVSATYFPQNMNPIITMEEEPVVEGGRVTDVRGIGAYSVSGSFFGQRTPGVLGDHAAVPPPNKPQPGETITLRCRCMGVRRGADGQHFVALNNCRLGLD